MTNLNSIFRKWFPKSLSREVIEVFAASPAIKKLGHNNEDDYDYLMILTVCREFKTELFARGIIFTATDVDCLFEQISEGKDTFTVRCTVRTKFEAQRKCWFGMQRFDMGEALGAGLDTFDHISLAIAQTFAYKAMLKRSSMTYGEKDDPEFRRKTGPKSYRERVLDSALNKAGIGADVIALPLHGGGSAKYADILDLPKIEFNQAIKLILGMEDLTGKLKASVVDIKSKKAQPVVAAMDAAHDAGY